MKSKEKKEIFAVIMILCLLWMAAERGNAKIKDGGLSRNEPGEGERQEILEAEVEGEIYEMEVTVGERIFTEKEAKNHLKAAKKEIDRTFPGKNKSLNRIEKPVVMKSYYQDGLVNAQWELENYDILNMEGNFVKTKLPRKGEVLSASVLLSCGKVKEEYSFSFHAYSPVLTMREKIENALEEGEAESKEKKVWMLPRAVGGKEVRWKEKSSHTIWMLPFLWIAFVILFKFRGIEEARKQKKKRETELLLFYPQLVTTLSLLLGAGMSVSKAWERMALRYQSKRELKKSAACEEMYYTYNEIREGVGERRAYESFGRRCGLPQYKKLASLLTQNLKKGTSEITEQLEKEAEASQRQRKNLAKKLGEEAGTKMLLPMMMMLAIVMTLVLVPAILSF